MSLPEGYIDFDGWCTDALGNTIRIVGELKHCDQQCVDISYKCKECPHFEPFPQKGDRDETL